MAPPLEAPVKGPILIISTANKKDRFKLLSDPSIPRPDIDAAIHPIFRAANFANASPRIYRNLQQALRLASTFLKYDSVLEWFVAPLLGLPLVDPKTGKTYLTDPLQNTSKAERRKLVGRVRRALNCLSHSVQFQFLTNSDVKFYARTTFCETRPVHTSSCTQHFRSPKSVLIELRKQYFDFLHDHYESRDLCEVLRHDFCLGVALVHEICHAVGVMRRNDLKEPCIMLDHLDQPEFGYAWENFMFGGIINPFDRVSSTVSFLMRKVWSDDKTAYAAGGKEWSTVPMSYIAQWFQKRTWEIIAVRGPTALPAPIARVKLRALSNHYLIMSDDPDALSDIHALKRELIGQYARGARCPGAVVSILTAKLQQTDSAGLQRYLLEAPTRVRHSAPVPKNVCLAGKHSIIRGGMMIRSYSNPLPTSPPPIPIDPRILRSETPLKRSADADEQGQVPSSTAADSVGRSNKRIKVSA